MDVELVDHAWLSARVEWLWAAVQRKRSAGIGCRTFALRHVADVQNSAITMDRLQKARS